VTNTVKRTSKMLVTNTVKRISKMVVTNTVKHTSKMVVTNTVKSTSKTVWNILDTFSYFFLGNEYKTAVNNSAYEI
jgi:hypothetical protein